MLIVCGRVIGVGTCGWPIPDRDLMLPPFMPLPRGSTMVNFVHLLGVPRSLTDGGQL